MIENGNLKCKDARLKETATATALTNVSRQRTHDDVEPLFASLFVPSSKRLVVEPFLFLDCTEATTPVSAIAHKVKLGKSREITGKRK